MANPFDSFSGFLPKFDVLGITDKILNYGMVIIAVAAVMGIAFFIYKRKNKKSSGVMKKIGWWEETQNGMVPLHMDDAEEITIAGTGLKVFYIKKRNLWLPRFTRGVTAELFYVCITRNRELVNFTLESLKDNMAKAGLNYDHTDMRWAAENTREFIKRNYKDKATPWWKEYKDTISMAIHILLHTVSLIVIIWLIRGLIGDIGEVAGSISSAIDKMNIHSPPSSGITPAG